MLQSVRLILVTLACALASVAAPPAVAQKFDPGSNYICPNDASTGVDCYLDAVTHLYTMCRHVKSIEIIEFGHAKSQEGVNGAKSVYCVEKQSININRPYQAALREAGGYSDVVAGLRALQKLWQEAMASLRWVPGEAPDSYEDRVNRVYDEMSFQIDTVRVGFTTAPDGAVAKAAPAAKPVRAKAANASSAPAKAKAP